MNPWINIKDRLPKDGEDVLAVWTQHGYYQYVMYDGGEWLECLPNAPREVIEDVQFWIAWPGVPEDDKA